MRRTIPAALARLYPQPAIATVLILIAALALIAADWAPVTQPFGAAAPVLILALVLAGAIVAAYRYPVHVRPHTKVLLVTVAYYLLATLVPPALAACAAGIGACAGELSQRALSGAYPSDIAAEVGRRVVVVLMGSLAAHAAGYPPSPQALLAAAIILGIGDALTVALVLAPMSGERPVRAIWATAREVSAAEAVQYIVGILGALAADQHRWALALLLVPAVLVYRALKITKEMHDSTRHLLESMADAVDLRDAYTGGHSRRVADYTARILRTLELHGPEVDLIVTAARVHDIGKIGVPDAVLHKAGSLSPEEWAQMKAHPVTGAALLARYPDFARGVSIVRGHHESLDGSGYPDGLRGDAIPFGARVIAVADTFDALTSDRPYRRGASAAKAGEILRQGRGTQWDPVVVDAMLRSLAERADTADAPAAESTALTG